MSDRLQESDFVAQIKRTLDDSADNLEAGVRSRLTRARHRALESRRARLPARLLTLRRVMVAAAAVLVLAVGVMVNLNEPAGPQHYSEIEDIELLATGDNPDFFVELDFYTWLAEEVEDAG